MKNSIENDTKIKSNLEVHFLRILVDSGCQVEAMRPPKRRQMPQVGAQDGPEAAEETPKTAQESPKSCLNGLQKVARRCLGARSRPRTAQEVPEGRPAPLQTSILDHFANDFGSFLIHF